MHLESAYANNSRKYVGQSIKIREGPNLLTGRAIFTDDLKFPNMLYVSFLRSPYAHARIKEIEVGDAMNAKGVSLVLTGEDIDNECYSPSMKNAKPYKRFGLARGKVIYAGEPVAAVLASDRYAAEDALDLIRVEYEPLPVILETSEALKSGATLIHDEMPDNVYYATHFESGSISSVFRNTDYLLEETFSNSSYTGSPIECRSCIADFNPYTRELKVWLPNQLIHSLKTMLSIWLKIPEHLISVESPQVGGAFGTKCGGFPEEVVVCALSMIVGRPVKWTETRTENLMSSVQMHEIAHNVQVAFDNTGKILGLSDKIVANIGSYATIGNFEPVTHSWTYLPGPYHIPNMLVDVKCVATNKGPFGAVRGFGRILGSFTIERVIELISRKLGIDPLEVRIKNTIKPNSFPYVSVTGEYYDNNDFIGCLQRTGDKFGYIKWRKFQTELKKQGKFVGIGISTSIGPSGLDATKTQGIPGWESVWMRMDPSGKVTIATGLCAQGQSHSTVLSQIAADILGVGIDEIKVIEGNTESTPYGLGTWSDRSAVAGGTATMHAAKLLRDRIIRIASYRFQVSPVDIVLEGSRAHSKSQWNKFLTFADIAWMAYYQVDLLPPNSEPGLEVTGRFVPPNIIYPDESGRRNESPTYSNSCHMAAVEVDIETGKVNVLQYASVHDAGTVINPAIVEGQSLGCLAQGLGVSLYEELCYNQSGQMVASTFTDYIIPSVDVIPVRLEIILNETPSSIESGFRGGGQSGSMATPAAIINAIDDALDGSVGIINRIPMSQERVWELVSKNKALYSTLGREKVGV